MWHFESLVASWHVPTFKEIGHSRKKTTNQCKAKGWKGRYVCTMPACVDKPLPEWKPKPISCLSLFLSFLCVRSSKQTDSCQGNTSWSSSQSQWERENEHKNSWANKPNKVRDGQTDSMPLSVCPSRSFSLSFCCSAEKRIDRVEALHINWRLKRYFCWHSVKPNGVTKLGLVFIKGKMSCSFLHVYCISLSLFDEVVQQWHGLIQSFSVSQTLLCCSLLLHCSADTKDQLQDQNPKKFIYLWS